MSASESILVVDSDAKVLHDVSLILESHGYTVLTARHGVAAIRAFESSKLPVSLLLTAVMMPGLSGFDVAGSLVQWNRSLEVIFMSDHDRQVLFAEESAGTKHFLRKPINEQTLLLKVRGVLGERRAPVIAASRSIASALTA